MGFSVCMEDGRLGDVRAVNVSEGLASRAERSVSGGTY